MNSLDNIRYFQNERSFKICSIIKKKGHGNSGNCSGSLDNVLVVRLFGIQEGFHSQCKMTMTVWQNCLRVLIIATAFAAYIFRRFYWRLFRGKVCGDGAYLIHTQSNFLHNIAVTTIFPSRNQLFTSNFGNTMATKQTNAIFMSENPMLRSQPTYHVIPPRIHDLNHP